MSRSPLVELSEVIQVIYVVANTFGIRAFCRGRDPHARDAPATRGSESHQPAEPSACGLPGCAIQSLGTWSGWAGMASRPGLEPVSAFRREEDLADEREGPIGVLMHSSTDNNL